jgi:hypothetical protein
MISTSFGKVTDQTGILQPVLMQPIFFKPCSCAANLFGHIFYSFKNTTTNTKMIFRRFATVIEECIALGIRHVIRSRNPAGETIPVLTKETTLSS